MKSCICGNDFLLKENMKPGKRTYAYKIYCRECGRWSYGVGLDPIAAQKIAEERWEKNEVHTV